MRRFKVAFIPTQNSGVTYYRMASWAWEMRKRKGVQVAVYGFNYDIEAAHPWLFDVCPEVEQRIEALVQIADITIWGPLYTSRALDLFGRLKMKYQKPMLYETDDDLTDVPQWNESQASSGPNSGYRANAMQHLQLSDGAICTTPFLKEKLEKHCGSVYIVPNSLDFSVWKKMSIKRHKDIRIGWAGGRSHSVDLALVVKPLQNVLKKYPQAKLVLVNAGLKTYAASKNEPWYFEGLKHQYADRYVTINCYPRFLASFRFDIGIAPLEICNFNKAKSNLRWLEYAGLKVPTVATKIGHFDSTLSDGLDAYLIPDNDPMLWEQRLSILIECEESRRQMGLNAWDTAKSQFNLYRNAGKYLKLLRDIAGQNSESEEPEWTSQPSIPILAA